MPFELPPIVDEDPIDDIQSTDLDLDSLITKYVSPIDRFRSYTAPIISAPTRMAQTDRESSEITQQETASSSFNNREPQESRAHAFYRMIGLPVVANDEAYYNPGFNPAGGNDEKNKHLQIASQVSNTSKLMQTMRENSARARLRYFKKGGSDASVFSVALGLPQSNDSKRFSLIDQSKAWDAQDTQMFTNNQRKIYINTNYEKTSGEEITNYFVQNSHILRPFTVDASIERTAAPAEKSMVCQPFLKSKKDTRFDEPDVYLLRPGIEFVLRLRLLQRSGKDALAEAIAVLAEGDQGVQELTQMNYSDLLVIASALLEENGITTQNANEVTQELLGGIYALELLTLNKYVKMIKGLVQRLYSEIEKLKEVTNNISWTPLCSEFGPEGGTELSNLIKTKKKRSEEDQRIARLTVKQQSAKRQVELSSDGSLDYRDFALSEFQNTDKLFEQELRDAKERRNQYIQNGSDALQTIEYITGEVSGLGLVDIMAIYTALWAIDVEVLVALLDENAFRRLYDNNKGLRVKAVTDRYNGNSDMTVTQAIAKFEQQIINVLAFADRTFEFLLGIKDYELGGAIPIVE